MLNAYPDSLGGNLGDIVTLLKTEAMQDVFSSFYILPSLYHSDLDRGFSVIDYDLNEQLANREDLDQLKNMGIDLKLDFILNHASAQSPQFQDRQPGFAEKHLLQAAFLRLDIAFLRHGSMPFPEAVPVDEKIAVRRSLPFFHKPGLPILMVEFPDGKKVPYWNTFYQEVHGRHYLGQMDVNIQSPKVWEFYRETLEKIASYGAAIVRLDAFAYAPKTPGKKNFLNDPETWELLQKIHALAEPLGLTLLPEIHAAYDEKIYQTLAEKGYATYDFFLPGLVIDAIENRRGTYLAAWAKEIVEKKISTVNMLGCHDGIPLLDLKGLLPKEEIQSLIDRIVSRGGMVKNLHGQKNLYYQVNATYYSALGESDEKMLLARAIQMFMPGKPQIWYLDLFAGKNDHEAVQRAGESGHKEINRTNISVDQIAEGLKKDVVQKQLALIRMRNTHKAFSEGAEVTISGEESSLEIRWEYDGAYAELHVNFEEGTYTIESN